MLDQLIDYVKNNTLFCIIVAAVVVAIIVTVIILIVTGKKKEDIDESLIEDDHAEKVDAETDATPVTDEAEGAEEETEEAEAEPVGAVAQSVVEDSVSKTVDTDEAAEQTEPEAEEVVEETDEAPATEEAQAEEVAEATDEATDEAMDEAMDDQTSVADETAQVQADEAEEVAEDAPSYSGKWTIGKISVVNEANEEMESAFFFQLKANNGEALLTSEEYTTQRGATQGIDTFKANIERGNFKISITGKGKYIVKLLTNQGTLLAQGEKYATRTQALNAINSIKRFAASAQRMDEVQVTTVPYVEEEAEERAYDPYKKGKWVIRKIIMESENDCSYCFELRASNGQVLFTSEEYATTASLKNGIKTHKKNIEAGNIRAVITRNGDYILKIFAGNGQLLCLGNHYKTKQLCLSAIESVKRFAASAPLDLDKLFAEE